MKVLLRILALSLPLLSSSSSYSQEKCNCPANLEKAIQKVEENYAGFPDKVTPKTKPQYERLKKDLRSNAITVEKPLQCFNVLKDYVNYFYDKHFRIEYHGPIDSAVVEIDVPAIREKYQRSKEGSITGIWKDIDGTEIAIIKRNGKNYSAVKISSAKDNFPEGFVYFTLTQKDNNNYAVKLYNRNISVEIPAKQIGNLLRIWNFQLWAKASGIPLTQNEQEEFEQWGDNNKGLLFKKLNSDFSYLKIPTFDNNEGAIQALVSKNDAVIRNTRYLIVDLTGNGGGSSGWVSLMPYLLTNPVDQGESFLRVSEENVARKLRDIEPFVTNPIPEEYKKYFPDEVVAKYKRAYQELPEATSTFYPIPSVSFPVDSVLRFPERIALIVDNFGGSSTEYFFYLTRQSKKVVTYGQPTVGMMDYVGMSIPTELPYDAFNLYIPIEKSSWTAAHPIDKTGFIPEILLKESQDNWIDRVMEDLSNR